MGSKTHEEPVEAPEAAAVETKDATRDERTELIETLQRLQADFDNYRRRTEAEKIAQNDAASDRLLGDILPILDGLDLAVAHTKEDTSTAELMNGILLVRDQLLGLLEDHGVTPMSESGPFDPRMHAAIITEETKEAPSKHIHKTFQRGYTRGGRVLRPARVSVAK